MDRRARRGVFRVNATTRGVQEIREIRRREIRDERERVWISTDERTESGGWERGGVREMVRGNSRRVQGSEWKSHGVAWERRVLLADAARVSRSKNNQGVSTDANKTEKSWKKRGDEDDTARGWTKKNREVDGLGDAAA